MKVEQTGRKVLVWAVTALAALAIALAAFALGSAWWAEDAYAEGNSGGGEQADSCNNGSGEGCEAPESCCADAEEVLKELGRV